MQRLEFVKDLKIYVRLVVVSLHEMNGLKAHFSKYDGKLQETVSLFILFQAFLQFSFWIFEALFHNNSNFNDSHVSDRINEQLQESFKKTKEVKQNERC